MPRGKLQVACGSVNRPVRARVGVFRPLRQQVLDTGSQELSQTGIDCILTVTRIIKSVVTGQAPVTLEHSWKNTPGQRKAQTKPKVVLHAYINCWSNSCIAKKNANNAACKDEY